MDSGLLVKLFLALPEPVWLAACRSGEPSGGFALPGPSSWYGVAAHGVWIMAFLPSELALNNPEEAVCSCSCYLFGGGGGSSLLLFAFFATLHRVRRVYFTSLWKCWLLLIACLK